MLRVGIYRPVGVPTANHAVMHTFMGHTIYTNGVGVTLFVHYHRLWKASNRGRAEARYPAFLL